MNDKKLIHDFKSDLLSLQEGLLLLGTTNDEKFKNKILNLMLEKCELLEKNIQMAKENLRQGNVNDLHTM